MLGLRGVGFGNVVFGGLGGGRGGWRVSGSGFGGRWVMLGHGGLGLGVWGLFWAWVGCFFACAGWCWVCAGVFWECGFGGLGWGRVSWRVGGSGFGGQQIILGHGGLGLGVGNLNVF